MPSRCWRCRISADVLNFLLFLVVSRRFGPEGMGEYGYGFALAGLVYYAATLGIDEYGVREYSRLPVERRPTLISSCSARSCASPSS